jgi:short-subunit dehydrogenase|tara:strand:+ start:1319 stop:2152 length:834 start_codon:yes stop_codon:yes gene_type:complete
MPTPTEYLKHTSVIIVTGGSSGIGCSIIKAIKNLAPTSTLCNLSRSKPGDFFDQHGIHIATDLSDSKAVAAAAAQLNIIIAEAEAGEVLLINNSGFGDYGRLQDLDRTKQLQMIDLNVRAVVDLTAHLLPQMLERGGCVVNVASTASFQPTAYLATYGATKAFVLNWTLALGEDLRGTKVRTLAVCPGPTRSNFFKSAGFETPPMQEGVSLTPDMTSEQVADLTLQALAKGKSLLVTGWRNKLIAFFGSKFPIIVVTRVGAAILRKMRLETHQGNSK